MTGEPTVFRNTRAILGESLIWDASRSAMLWCDITAGLLHASPLDGAVDGSTDATLHLPAQDVDHEWRSALVGNVRHLQALVAHEFLAVEVP